MAEALLDPGDIVLVEAPTYVVFLGVLESRGAQAIGVATDEGGLRLDALEATLAAIEARGELDRVKLIYTISEHSNPTGLSLDAGRRGPLVELARRWSKEGWIFVLEDAAYRGLTFSGLSIAEWLTAALTAAALVGIWQRLLLASRLNTTQALAAIREETEGSPEVEELVRFIETSKRGVVK